MIRSRLRLLALVAAAAIGSAAAAADARADDAPKNLKVLAKDQGKTLGNGMKALSKGLGVECKACHVKGKFDSDEIPAKEAARTFFGATVGQPDKARREEALKTLLAAMKIEKAKDEKKVWEGVDLLKKQ